MNYGILSSASIVPRFVEGIRESKEDYVYGIASRTLEKAKRIADQLAIEHYYGSYDELLKDPHIDIVYIPTVNSLHYRDCKKALLHHKHVIVEKPFVLKEEQARELFSLAKENNCFLMEAQKSVYLPTTLRLKELIESQIIGDIKYIELKAGFPGRFDYTHWMCNLDEGGGALYGSATYTIEYLSYLFDYKFHHITGSRIISPSGCDDLCTFQLSIHNNILVSSTIAMNVALKNEAVFYGDKGYIVVENFWKAKGLEIHIDDEIIREDFSCKSEFVYEINHIHECIKNHLIESPLMTQEMTCHTIHLVNQLQQSWK